MGLDKNTQNSLVYTSCYRN